MGIDLQMTQYLNVLNDDGINQQDKFDFCRKLSEDYFEIDRFEQFCSQNFADLNDRMVDFYDEKFDEILKFAIEFSKFPDHEHDHFYGEYKNMMDTIWRKDPDKFLQSHILKS